MGLRVYGLGAVETLDRAGDLLKIDGLDTTELRLLQDEHEKDDFFHKIGAITYHKKIMSEKDCENSKQLRCWQVAKAPFLYAEAELADEFEHPNAKSAASLIKFVQRPDISDVLSVGFSVHGGIYERQNDRGDVDINGNVISEAAAAALSLTYKPCNPKCKLFLENDLTKSDLDAPPPKEYYEALKRQQDAKSFKESVAGELFAQHLRLSKLKKSLEDFHTSTTALRCESCGHTAKFFKAGDVPHRCGNNKCQKVYSLSNLWKALNK
jgi:hypothetical protein